MNTLADRPRAKSLSPLRALLPFLRPYRGVLAAAMAALIFASAAMLALPVALRQLIDHGIAAKNPGTINLYFIGFLAAAVVYGGFAALRFYLVTWLGERVVADVRTAVYRRVVRMDPTFYEVTRTGEVVPVSGGRLALGTWQAIYLWEHRTAPHTRRIVVTVTGHGGPGTGA